MKRNGGVICAIILVGIFIFGMLFSCASTKVDSNLTESETEANAKKKKKTKKKKIKYKDDAYRAAILSGDYASAQAMLNSLNSLTIAQLMDLGLLQHYAGEYEEAAETMELATQAIGDAFAVRLNKEGGQKASGGTVLSETATSYKGNIYEYLLVDTFNALNYYQAAFNKGFRYEEYEENLLGYAYSCLDQVSTKQQEYAGKYSYLLEGDDENGENDENSATLQAALSSIDVNEDPTRLLPAKPTEANIYKTSALADYLQIVVGRQYGVEDDNSPIVRELNALAPQVDTSFYESRSTDGRIEVLALAGNIAQRAEHVEYFPNTQLAVSGITLRFKYAWIEYPKDHVSDSSNFTVTLSDGQSKTAVLLESFDDAVKNDIALNARRAAWRSIVRSTTTKASLVATSIVGISQIDNELVRTLAISALGPSLNAIDLKEVADLRQSMALPSKSYCTGFTVAPGNYTVTVARNGTIVYSVEVEVKQGKPVLVEVPLCK